MRAIAEDTSTVPDSKTTYLRTSGHSEDFSSGSATAGLGRLLSFLALIGVWLPLEFYGIFSPGLLDDVDSVYIESAREMLVRHDFVTPYVDGIRFFDKPPLMYWLASASMRIFGIHDWAARLPLALLTLALFFAVYLLGSRLFGERGGFYSAVVTASSIGPYLFTRFFIPDVLLALWMTMAVHLFLKALSLLNEPPIDYNRLRITCWAFAAVMSLNVLTKGLIGLVFPIGVVFAYLTVTHQLNLVRRLHPYSSAIVFTFIAAPWHVLVALRNPAVSGAVVARGWFWFYIINEHFMRFFGKRIPHDYGQVPLLLFLVLAALWLAPWASFLPTAASWSFQALRGNSSVPVEDRYTALLLLLWAGIVLVFFCLSSRQEYYSLPALPALALLVGGLLTRAEEGDSVAERQVLAASRWFLLPLSLLVAAVTGYFAVTAPTPTTGVDIASLLLSNPASYNLALGHIFDLTGRAMGLFRAALIFVCFAMLLGGPLSHLFRTRRRHLFANISLTIASLAVLLCVHEGLTRFYPILGSKSLALAINGVYQPGDRILIDGEYTLGSTLNFYTQQPVALVDGRMNGTWYGSYWPDAPNLFETNDSLHKLWASKSPRLFLLTYNPARGADLSRYGPVYRLAAAGGKTVLTNRP
ncbi:4-amino-4-deoxy-L-arabinose transferase-like glycosyltransferase [Granulicella aggregans]|uniref:4-amino-4-deoxy-L-arabinose transferase-like glycosyltransferase n=1 Tax=Granulicella aggregans TaxID=474949 RepID=A0A7W7ZJ36_9BACT|nr:glycosyltransferase family 39 protein [Granulicella aggregans]MBB5060862.1 4-amino-4-deoxy-L-arabinose transferase-like glycosyltransferase [Granulicella aggregans]